MEDYLKAQARRSLAASYTLNGGQPTCSRVLVLRSCVLARRPLSFASSSSRVSKRYTKDRLLCSRSSLARAALSWEGGKLSQWLRYSPPFHANGLHGWQTSAGCKVYKVAQSKLNTALRVCRDRCYFTEKAVLLPAAKVIWSLCANNWT